MTFLTMVRCRSRRLPLVLPRLGLLAAFLLCVCLGQCAGRALAAEPGERAGAPAQAASGQTGIASWYGDRHDGRRTANGEIHRSRLLTAAHRGLPFGTLVKVTNLRSGSQVVVRINDRGPYVRGRLIDLSEGAARNLGMLADGFVPVSIEVVGHGG